MKEDKARIETMSGFFTSRANGYDEHMLSEVEGCMEGYIKMAEILPQGVNDLLDLGCGTGLELEEIFKKYPTLNVTGIDITPAMLDKLKAKYPGKKLNLINADYFAFQYEREKYDAAISFQTMHHLSREDKLRLYRKILASLKPSCFYIESDYMLTDEAEELRLINESRKLRSENGIPESALCHIDIPLTVEHQVALFLKAGFGRAEAVWRKGNTTIIKAQK